MKSDTPLDYAVLQLSPKRSRCELFVSGEGKTEKLASGLLKPFATHLRVAEEQVAQAVQFIRLEVQKNKNSYNWFTKGTLERFVRFVSTPEVIELVITFDAEMSQLEVARRIYLQGAGDQPSDALGESGSAAAVADITKRELLRAIDVRLVAVRQDLTKASARAAAAGFTLENVSELLFFADHFGACRLNEACTKFISLCQRRPELFYQSKDRDDNVRFSSGSDMSIDDATDSDVSVRPNGAHPHQQQKLPSKSTTAEEHDSRPISHASSFSSLPAGAGKSVEFPLRSSSSERDEDRESDGTIKKETENVTVTEPAQPSQQQQQEAGRLSVQDRISMFENKQKERSGEVVSRNKTGKSELRRLSSDIGASAAVEKSVLRRWSGTSDMSLDLNTEKKENSSQGIVRTASSSSLNSRSHSSNSHSQSGTFPSRDEDIEASSRSQSRDIRSVEDTGAKDSAASRNQFKAFPSTSEDTGLKDPQLVSQTQIRIFPSSSDNSGLKDKTASHIQSRAFASNADSSGLRDQAASQTQFRASASNEKNSGLKDRADSQIQFSFFECCDDNSGLKDQEAASQTQFRSFTGSVSNSGLKDPAASQARFKTFPGSADSSGLKDPPAQFRVFSSSPDNPGLKDWGASQIQSRAFPSSTNSTGLNDLVASRTQFRALSSSLDSPGQKDPVASHSKFRAFLSKAGDIGLKDPAASQFQSNVSLPSKSEDIGLTDTAASQTQPGAFPNKTEGPGYKEPSVSQNQLKTFPSKAEGIGTGDLGTSYTQLEAFPDKAEDVGKKDLVASQSQYRAFPIKGEDSQLKDSCPQEMKLHRQTSAPGQSKKLLGRKDDSLSSVPLYQSVPAPHPETRHTLPLVHGNSKPAFPGRNIAENSRVASIEQAQKIRQTRGNQELNQELQIKANELEALFAAHKLRVPGDQLGTERRSKLVDEQLEPGPTVVEKKLVEMSPSQWPDKNTGRESLRSSNNGTEFDANLLMNMVDNSERCNMSNQKLGNIGSSEDLRGKFYERYMQKREAKLREESRQKRAQKEAELKAMQDSLERSRAEMKAKFTGSSDRQDPALHARMRAERLRSFNFRHATKTREQAEAFASEEDVSDFSEQKILFSDGSSRTVSSKKILPNRILPSSTPRTSAAAVPKPTAPVKATNSSGRCRGQLENPLAQSVPNFSDFRKENTKPSSGINKTTSRQQLKNYARSRSTSEGNVLVKEEKQQRSRFMRKSSVGPGELKDLSPLNSDGVVLTPLKFSKDQIEQSLYNKIPKNGESKPFLRKGNGIGPGAGPGVAKLKASVATENLKDGEDTEELVEYSEFPTDMVKEEDEEFGGETGEEALKAVHFNADSDNEIARLSQESEKSIDLESENGEILRPIVHMNDSASPVAAVSEHFDPSVGNMQDSPGESPVSWNSRAHHSFSYALEASDLEASLDSPVGSPASWNSHSMSQVMEAEAARMRRKWGSAQKPILVATASQHSRKDVTKGFKRLLKFGRKTRGAETLVTDWVSASTTSEGDDDTEDGRDLANRSSEDLRKSRMGFSQAHPLYDGFHEDDIFHEQAAIQSLRSSIPAPPTNFRLREDHLSGSYLKGPRSFFSLSSFRSKGSESKPR